MADPGLFRQVTERVAGGSLASAADASALARNKLREAAETATWQEGHPPEAPVIVEDVDYSEIH